MAASPDLNIHLTTFNCGRSEVHVDYFASSLYSSLAKTGSLPPDLIVLALQEIAPIGYAFLGGSLLAPYFTRIADALHKAAQWTFGKDAQYEHVLTRNVGMTGIMVFAREGIMEQIRGIEEAGTGVGLWEMGNKGAVGVRLELEDTSVSFVAAHLAPAENAWERRNEDWKNICRTLVFEAVDAKQLSGEQQPLLSSTGSSSSRPHGLFDPPSHVFFAGDLNYRTSDTQPNPKDFETWPQPMALSSDTSHWSKLLSHDQLTRELHDKKTLHLLSEAPIDFPPTYKYSSRAQKLAEQTADIHADSTDTSNKIDGTSGIKLYEIQEQVWLWAKHRVPSWCDRILFLASAPPTVHSYTALPVQPTSDHRPVSLSCSIPRTQPQTNQNPPFEIVSDWETKKARARRLEFIVGLGAYLGLTTPGQTLLGGTALGVVAGYLILQYILK